MISSHDGTEDRRDRLPEALLAGLAGRAGSSELAGGGVG